MLNPTEFEALVDKYNAMLTKGAITEDHHKILMEGVIKTQHAPQAEKATDPLDDFDTSSMWDLKNLSKNKALRQQYPWADRYVQLALERNRINAAVGVDGETEERYRELAVGKAKNGLLSTIDLFILRCLLFTDNPLQGAWTLIEMVLNTPAADLIPLHNFLILQDYTDAHRARIAGRALACPEPLFPPKYLRDLNEILLQRNDSMQGGAPPTRLFRPAEDSGLVGGGYMAPLLSADGVQQAALDLSQLTDYLTQQFAISRDEAKSLETLMKRAKARSDPQASSGYRRRQPQSNNWRNGNGRGPNVWNGAGPAPLAIEHETASDAPRKN